MRFDQHHGNIGALQRTDGAQSRVEFDIVLDPGGATQTGGVDEDKAAVLIGEFRVD